jgi:hypothetical protein
MKWSPLCLLAATCWACARGEGILELNVVDAEGVTVPARIELLDDRSKAHVAGDALTINTECFVVPFPDWASSLQRSQSIDNPYVGTRQFYVDGAAHASLPSGRYRVTASRGVEYRVARAEVEVTSGKRTWVELAPERWIDMPALGWFSADDHLHITRVRREDDARIGTWMRAEDLHIANLLQMGNAEQFDITPQYAFGDAGVYRAGETQLVSGQEHPRTHVLGHTIVLGAEAAIDRRDSYTIYRGFWEEAVRLGGAAGYAHWGAGYARDGLAIDAPSGLLSFIEVLQFDLPYFEVWYDLLNLGARLAPSAGTDYPCIPSIPGRERFYTRVEGLPTRASWVDGVRRGRTFVTNGPMLDLDVGGAGIGDELLLEAPRDVRIRGRARFDPARDDVRTLELVRDGVVVAESDTRPAPGEIALDLSLPVQGSAWFALRASGSKIGETPMLTPWYLTPEAFRAQCHFGCGAWMGERASFVGSGRARPSAAHTGAVYVSVADIPATPPAALVRRALERLDQLRAKLADERLDELVVFRPFSEEILVDGVPASDLRRDRLALTALIDSATAHYRSVLAESSAGSD